MIRTTTIAISFENALRLKGLDPSRKFDELLGLVLDRLNLPQGAFIPVDSSEIELSKVLPDG